MISEAQMMNNVYESSENIYSLRVLVGSHTCSSLVAFIGCLMSLHGKICPPASAEQESPHL